MQVADWMITKVHTCRREDSLAEVARALREMDCGCLPVVDRLGCVTGMITDRDICMIAGDSDSMLDGITVSSIRQRSLVTCSPHDDDVQVLDLIRTHLVRRLPVVNSEGGLVGIVSLGDLAGLLSAGEPSEKIRIDARQVIEVMARLSRARYRTRYSDPRHDREDDRSAGHDHPPLD